ncbi:Delta(8)-fatty-acid desaturase 1 [Linum grandiflorum]
MAESKKKYISLEELAKHNTSSDLWISIQGKIYNVTDWTKSHPGGSSPLLNLAGQDASDAYYAFHPPTAWKHLDAFFTGYHLQDYTVSEVSKDYRRLVSEFAKLGLFDKKGHIQSGWLGHDSGHYQIMTSRGMNRVAQLLAGNCLAGISIGWWKWNHNAHHIACNSLDFDPDLQHIPFFAVSSTLFSSITSCFYDRKLSFDPAARFLVSYQHLTFYPVMCFARINLFAQSFLLLLSKRRVPDRAQELVGLFVFWVWYPLLVSCLPNWWERVMFVVVSFSVTGIQHVQFCLNHFSSNVYVGPPSGNDWFEKQTKGTLDISCSSWMDWFHGGLQFQVEHHLFPRLPRCQLRKVSPFVQELCKKHNLPYNIASFWGANVLTCDILRTVALQARDIANPIPKNLVWEALNTHG